MTEYEPSEKDISELNAVAEKIPDSELKSGPFNASLG